MIVRLSTRVDDVGDQFQAVITDYKKIANLRGNAAIATPVVMGNWRWMALRADLFNTVAWARAIAERRMIEREESVMNQVIYDLEIIERVRIIETSTESRRLLQAYQRMSAMELAIAEAEQ